MRSDSLTAAPALESRHVPGMEKPRPVPLLLLGILLVSAIVVSLGLGKFQTSPGELVSFVVQAISGRGQLSAERFKLLENLLFEIRLPRVLAACMVGAALSVSGAAYQAMFVNPLVSPRLLGVTSGASFGAVIGMVTSTSWQVVQAAALAGGLVAVGMAVGLAIVWRSGGTLMLVLGGIVSDAFFSSLVSMVKYASDSREQLPAIVYWLMGNMALVDRSVIGRVAIPMGISIVALLLLARHLDVLSMGDEEARSLGVNVAWIRGAVIASATVASALTVVMVGSVGWVGLIVPHVARMIVGPDNETLLPASVLLGALYLLVVDGVSRSIFTFEIPIGIVTALVGIPFLVAVLWNARREWS